jgi:hypothetical protein
MLIEYRKDGRWVAELIWDGRELAVIGGRVSQKELRWILAKLKSR